MADLSDNDIGQVEASILVGITGSIAAAMMCGVLLSIRQLFPAIRLTVIVSESAHAIVPASTFANCLGVEVHRGWSQLRVTGRSHVDLVRGQDLLMVCPATANILGKAANGISDDLLSTCIVAAECGRIFAPSMNSAMWHSKAVQRNVRRLRDDGAIVVEPVAGPATVDSAIEIGSMPPVRELSVALLDALRASR